MSKVKSLESKGTLDVQLSTFDIYLLRLSIIIPTYNEETRIASTIQTIKKKAARPQRLQIIVADGGSEDQTVSKARKEDIILVRASRRRR